MKLAIILGIVVISIYTIMKSYVSEEIENEHDEALKVRNDKKVEK